MPSYFQLFIAPVISFLPYGLFSKPSSNEATWRTSPIPNHCTHLSPITKPEFDGRQLALANRLVELGGAAYVAESSANTQYFANFSVPDWKLSERPLLLIIRPVPGAGTSGGTRPQVALLTPKFEHRRALTLPIPAYGNTGVQYIDWAEDQDPYQAAFRGLGLSATSDATIFVDSGIRKFVADGLEAVGPNIRVLSAPREITSLRERKSPHELELMKCANEATVLAIRDVHKHVRFGMRESEVRGMLSKSLSDVGLKNAGCLTLFGANAALPHGSGTDRALTSSDFALFDCGGLLHGYQSDITRTVAFAKSRIPERHLELWKIIQDVQAAALKEAKAGALTKKPDELARQKLRQLDLEQYFTHRLGHGIGLDGHERPYLRGNSDDVIQTGHTFSNEPGVYIEDVVGIRLEDCFYIAQDGSPSYFTGPQTSPWEP